MKAKINIGPNAEIMVDLSKPLPISIPIKEGSNNPNCYWANPVAFKTIKADGFIGSVAEGGSVNYQKLEFTPHGNGTHIEGYGHITSSGATVNKQLNSYHFYSKVITLTPEEEENGDKIFKPNQFLKNQSWENIKAVIIRTAPNDESKLNRSYSGTNPPYLSPKLITFLVEQGIEHLLIDLPSIDKEVDDGALLSHRAFWDLSGKQRKQATISELIFVPNHILDGNYLLNLQTINLEMDAAPCHPVLYEIEENNRLST